MTFTVSEFWLGFVAGMITLMLLLMALGAWQAKKNAEVAK